MAAVTKVAFQRALPALRNLMFPRVHHPCGPARALATERPPQTDYPILNNSPTTPTAVDEIQSYIGPLGNHSQFLSPQAVTVVVSGPSGVGKDAVINRLKQMRPDLHFVVTATTRPMRVGEVDGVDYFFVGKDVFEGWIHNNQLLEHALVYGEYKGIPRTQVDDALARGSDVILRLDVQGAATMRRLLPGVVSIFVAPSSEAELVARLVGRKTESLDKMLVRIQTARQEMAQMGDFDYVVVNRDGQLDECARQISCILDAEKARVRK